jgi:hypothetical protein
MSHDLFCAMIILVGWPIIWMADRRRPCTARELGLWAIWFANLAIVSGVISHRPLAMVAYGALAAWLAYHAWKRRKPRQRKPSKVGARVRDLGHRLVVSAT